LRILGQKTLKSNRGVALIITILIVSLLVTLSLQFMTTTFSHNISAINLSEGIKGGCAAKSGINYAIAVLYEDLLSTEFDSLQELWADSETLTSIGSSLFDDIHLEIGIVDHSGKININRLVMKGDGEEGEKFDEMQKSVLMRLLKSLDLELEDDEIGDLINSIKDWIDEDDELTEEEGIGAESTYYQGLSPPYSCRNGPMETLDELQFVKGMTKEVFEALSPYLTVYGDEEGKININTADRAIIKSLSEDIHDEEVDTIIEYREEADDNELKDYLWYKTALNTGTDLINRDLIKTTSTHFEIISKGSNSGMGKKIRAIIERKEQKLTLLSWSVE